MKNFISTVSGLEFNENEKVLGKSIRKSIFDLIQKEIPTFDNKSFISISELNHFRQKYIEGTFVKEFGQLNDLEQDVLNAMQNQEILIPQLNSEDEIRPSTLGQRWADKIASFGGSWKFIIIFGIFILLWISSNMVLLSNKGFDPYPFILLNLILSCLAAMQAPIIMMSQNRQEEKDRERSQMDYMINLKSELEIRMLHEKIDHLIIHQQQELFNIQQEQIGMMNDIMKQIKIRNEGNL